MPLFSRTSKIWSTCIANNDINVAKLQTVKYNFLIIYRNYYINFPRQYQIYYTPGCY